MLVVLQHSASLDLLLATRDLFYSSSSSPEHDGDSLEGLINGVGPFEVAQALENSIIVVHSSIHSRNEPAAKSSSFV